MGALDAQTAVKRDEADNIVATVELMKDGTQGDEFVSRLEVVEIGIDDDGDLITSCVVAPLDGYARKEQPAKKPERAILRDAFLETHDRLADSAAPQPGLDGKLVKKVKADVIRDELKDRGYLDKTDKGQITTTSRSLLLRAKQDLFTKRTLIEAGGWVWRI